MKMSNETLLQCGVRTARSELQKQYYALRCQNGPQIHLNKIYRK